MNSGTHWQVYARVVLVAALAFTGCKKKDEPTKGTDTGKTTATTDTKKEPAPSKAGAGIDDPANDKAVVALAKEAVKCKWEGSSGLKYDCPALEAFNKAEPVKTGKVDATLLNFLADPAKEVRWLAARALYNWGSEFSKNTEMAKKVLAAGRAEKDKDISRQVGDLVGKINVTKTGLTDDIKKLLAESDNTALRQGIVGGVLWNNRTDGGFYDLLQQMARTEKDKEVRKAAASTFWVNGSERHDDTCKLWLELSADADDDLAGHSSYHCGFWSHDGGCTAQWDALLDNIEKRPKVKSSMMSASLGYLYKQKKATDAQKKRVLKIARAMVENKDHEGMVRGDALKVVGENDPANAKAYAAKFEDDKEFFVKSAAKTIKEKK